MLPWSPYSKSTKMAEKDQDLKKIEDSSKEDLAKESDAGDAKPVAKPKVTESSEAKKSPKKTLAKSPSKDAKSKARTPKKKESPVEEDESEDEELVGILDQPLVIAGKRDRKTTDFLVNTFKPQSIEKKKVDVPEGKGETLASMPRVQFQLNRIVADELKPLHRILFGRAGTNSEVKRNIRLFNGFDFEKDSVDYQKKVDQVDRFTQDSLRRLCEILDVDKKGKKEDVFDRVMDFLMKPTASGNVLPETKKKTPQRKKSKSKRKSSTQEKKGSPKKKDGEESGSENDEEEEQDQEEEKEKEKEVKKSPRKKKKGSADEDKKEKSGKKESKSSTKKDKKVVSIKISPGKKGKRKKGKKGNDSQESSDDEPLSKKTKKSPPTNDDINALVKELLEGADLEKITMKSVCKQVYDRFPDFDLTDRKEFIKETVKEIIT